MFPNEPLGSFPLLREGCVLSAGTQCHRCTLYPESWRAACRLQASVIEHLHKPFQSSFQVEYRKASRASDPCLHLVVKCYFCFCLGEPKDTSDISQSLMNGVDLGNVSRKGSLTPRTHVSHHGDECLEEVVWWISLCQTTGWLSQQKQQKQEDNEGCSQRTRKKQKNKTKNATATKIKQNSSLENDISRMKGLEANLKTKLKLFSTIPCRHWNCAQTRQ